MKLLVFFLLSLVFLTYILKIFYKKYTLYSYNNIKERTFGCKDENRGTWDPILPQIQSSSMKANLGLCCTVQKMSSLNYPRHLFKISYAMTSFSPLPRKKQLNHLQILCKELVLYHLIHNYFLGFRV